VSYPKTKADEVRIQGLVNNYDKILKKIVDRQIEELQFPQLTDVVNDKIIKISLCVQLGQLIYRNYIALVRNPAALIGRIVISLFVSITSLGIFWNFGGKLKDETDETKIQGVVLGLANSMFFMCIAQLALYEFATVMEF